MKNLNVFCVEGRIVRNAVKRQINADLSACDFAIAVNNSKKDKASGEYVDSVSFFDLTLMGKYADNMFSHLTKGKLISIVGYLKQDRWEKDGKKYQKISLVPKEINFILSPKAGDEEKATASAVEATSDDVFDGEDYEESFENPSDQGIF